MEGERALAAKETSFAQHLALPPEAIEARSFDIIRELLPDLTTDDEREMPIILRVIHTTGDPSIAKQIRIHPLAIDAGLSALRAGASILADVKMVAAGINKTLANKYGCQVTCVIDQPEVAELAQRQHITRSAAAFQSFRDQIDGSIIAIGNAPTALFTLLDCVDAGYRPALIVGTPVGFVGAAESKAALVKRNIPFITIEGTRGGSATSAAIVNALMKLGA
jgi:precorrin-8X/cobalt-precorrin-8 methylmutase